MGMIICFPLIRNNGAAPQNKDRTIFILLRIYAMLEEYEELKDFVSPHPLQNFEYRPKINQKHRILFFLPQL